MRWWEQRSDRPEECAPLPPPEHRGPQPLEPPDEEHREGPLAGLDARRPQRAPQHAPEALRGVGVLGALGQGYYDDMIS